MSENFSENHADLAAGQPLPIEIDGKTYQLNPLRARDFAAIRARMRATQVREIMQSRDIDPMTKRYALSMQKPPTMMDVIEEITFPSTALWLVTQQIKMHHAEVTEEWVEQHCNVMELITIISDISGLSDIAAESELDVEKNGKTSDREMNPPRLGRGTRDSGQSTISTTGETSSGV